MNAGRFVGKCSCPKHKEWRYDRDPNPVLYTIHAREEAEFCGVGKYDTGGKNRSREEDMWGLQGKNSPGKRNENPRRLFSRSGKPFLFPSNFCVEDEPLFVLEAGDFVYFTC